MPSRKDSIMNNALLAGALKELNSQPVNVVKASTGRQSVSSLSYDTASKQLTMVLSGVELNFERGTRKDQATGEQVANSSIKLVQVGKGNFGHNVFGAKIDGTKIRCNMAFRMNLANEQHAKDSDEIIS